jgi:hypothetical protein
MFQAQILTANGTANGSDVFGPWMPRGGDNIVCTVEIISMSGSSPTGLLVEVWTKAKSDTGDGTGPATNTGSTTSFGSTSSPGRYSATYLGMNELVRYKFKPGTTDGKWAMFRMLPPSWFDSVRP